MWLSDARALGQEAAKLSRQAAAGDKEAEMSIPYVHLAADTLARRAQAWLERRAMRRDNLTLGPHRDLDLSRSPKLPIHVKKESHDHEQDHDHNHNHNHNHEHEHEHEHDAVGHQTYSGEGKWVREEVLRMFEETFAREDAGPMDVDFPRLVPTSLPPRGWETSPARAAPEEAPRSTEKEDDEEEGDKEEAKHLRRACLASRPHPPLPPRMVENLTALSRTVRLHPGGRVI